MHAASLSFQTYPRMMAFRDCIHPCRGSLEKAVRGGVFQNKADGSVNMAS